MVKEGAALTAQVRDPTQDVGCPRLARKRAGTSLTLNYRHRPSRALEEALLPTLNNPNDPASVGTAPYTDCLAGTTTPVGSGVQTPVETVVVLSGASVYRLQSHEPGSGMPASHKRGSEKCPEPPARVSPRSSPLGPSPLEAQCLAPCLHPCGKGGAGVQGARACVHTGGVVSSDLPGQRWLVLRLGAG